MEVTRLRKRYPIRLGLSSLTALEDVSFSMEEGEILGFLGPNGAGKTTTIKCLLGLLRPSAGRISVWGLSPAHPGARRRIGYVPENPDYDDAFTPLEILSLFARMRRLRGGRRSHIELLSRVGLTGWERTRLRKFSKGMKQRMSLAIALQAEPDLMILDEPTGGLDPMARSEFRSIILEENRLRGTTIFLSSHLLSEVETVCSRAMILSRGRVVREGRMVDLLREENLWQVDFIGDPPAGLPFDAEIVPSPSFDARPEDEPGSGSPVRRAHVGREELQGAIDILRSSGSEIVMVGPVFGRLEDVFLRATGSEREKDPPGGGEPS